MAVDAQSLEGATELAGFRFNQIVIVQSLESHESQTGADIAAFLREETKRTGRSAPIRYIECESKPEFLKLLTAIEHEIRTGARPILQVECHGDPAYGLEFANGSELSWDDLGEGLRRLNIASEFNLMAVFSACYGAEFVRQLYPAGPSPCYLLVSPTSQAVPYELREGLKDFYREFLQEADLGPAIRALNQRKLLEGRWFCMPAEWWFSRAVQGYFQNQCTPEAVDARVNETVIRLRNDGVVPPQRTELLSIFRTLHAQVVREMFDLYFAVNEVPDNLARFRHCLVQAQIEYEVLKAAGTHIL